MKNARFAKLFTAIRAGDAPAAAQLVRQYEPYIRCVVRMRLTDEHLRRVFDSLDICQSILGEFFARVNGGAYPIQSPAELRKLLATMAINKVLDKARAEKHHGGGLPDGWDTAAVQESAESWLTRRELVEVVRARLTEFERLLFDERALGRTWAEIAAQNGGHPDALRMRLLRAMARIRREMKAVD